MKIYFKICYLHCLNLLLFLAVFCGVRGTGYGVRGTRYGVGGTGCEVRGAEYVLRSVVKRGEGTNELYEEKEKPVIFTTINRREMIFLQQYLQEVDENAFLTILDAREVLGEGFKPLKEE